jgi:sterol desaturase/sphingolipid hydroxylase (fatty acid hydroxylase superfamily)
VTELEQRLYDAAYTLVFNLAKAVLAFLQRDSLLFWPFVMSTVVIGMLAWLVSREAPEIRGSARFREFFTRYCGRQIWWHPSARVDYRFYFVNAMLFPILFGPLLFRDGTIARLLEQGVGTVLASIPAGLLANGPGVAIAYTLLFFLAYDLGRFIAHSLLHDVPWLWEFHKVHHSAEVLTPLTGFRAHPLDLALMAWVPTLMTGAVTWGFHRMVSADIGLLTFFGLHVVMWVFSLAGNLRHWHVWISYGPTLNRWLISPAHHQLHHSAEERHWGCNRGFELAVWDRLYGTLYIPSENREAFRMGLGDGTDGHWHTVSRLYFLPFGLLFDRIVRKNRTAKPIRSV